MRANELESERMNAVFLGHFFLMSFLLYLTLFFSLCSFSHSPRVSRSNSAVGSNRANVYTLTNRSTLIFVDWTFFSGVCVCVKIVAIRTFEFLNLWNGTNSNSQHIPDKYVNFTWEFAAITAYWYCFFHSLSVSHPSPSFFLYKIFNQTVNLPHKLLHESKRMQSTLEMIRLECWRSQTYERIINHVVLFNGNG